MWANVSFSISVVSICLVSICLVSICRVSICLESICRGTSQYPPKVWGLTAPQGGVSISTTDIRPGVGPFCNGQITWVDGPSPGRTVRRAYWNRPLFMAHLNSCTNQLTGIHLSQAESSLSGHTSIYMVKHQICKVPYTGRLSWHPLVVGVPACTSLTREVFVIQSVRDGGQYSQSGYAFRKTSFSLETLTPNGGSSQRANLISSKLYASIIMSHHAFQAWK